MTNTRIHFGFLVLFKYCKSGKVLKNKSTNLNEKQKNCWIVLWEDVVEEMADSGNGTGSLYFAKILYIKLFFSFKMSCDPIDANGNIFEFIYSLLEKCN